MSDPFEGLFDSGEVLERVGVNLTTQARRGDLEPVRCRDAEIARVVDILLRQSKNNPALIGKAGVGKTAIVEGLAQRVLRRSPSSPPRLSRSGRDCSCSDAAGCPPPARSRRRDSAPAPGHRAAPGS